MKQYLSENLTSFEDILNVLMEIAGHANQLGAEAHEMSDAEAAGQFAEARNMITETKHRLKNDIEDAYVTGPVQIIICRKSGFSNMVILVKETAHASTGAKLAEEQEVNTLVAASENPAEVLNNEYFDTAAPTGIPYKGMEDGPSW
jgi:hypothetical protein